MIAVLDSYSGNEPNAWPLFHGGLLVEPEAYALELRSLQALQYEALAEMLDLEYDFVAARRGQRGPAGAHDPEPRPGCSEACACLCDGRPAKEPSKRPMPLRGRLPSALAASSRQARFDFARL